MFVVASAFIIVDRINFVNQFCQSYVVASSRRSGVRVECKIKAAQKYLRVAAKTGVMWTPVRCGKYKGKLVEIIAASSF